MSKQKASTVAKAFVNVGLSRFGCPVSLHSDKSSNLMSNRFKDMSKKLGANRTSTKSSRKRKNIELTNCTIEESVAK